MASNITLSAGVRQNLLSLQSTADLMSTTQNRLATGKKVNSALDNPNNFFTSSALQSRAGDMSSLLDSMSNGIKTLEAADNGLKSITKTLESMQSTLRQARQDKTFETASYAALSGTPAGTEALAFSGGAIGDTPVSIALTTSVTGTGTPATPTTLTGTGGAAVTSGTAGTIEITAAGVNGGTAISVALANGDTLANVATKINTAAGSTIADASSGQIVLSNPTGGALTIADASGNSAGTTTAIGFATGNRTGSGGSPAVAGATTVTAKTVDTLVNEINSNASLTGKVRASNDNGSLRIENLSTQDLSVVGASTAGLTGGTGASNTQAIGGNTVRADLAKQFNELRDQLDKFADDASFNGINLLRGDNLKLTFNETGTSSIDISTKDQKAVNSSELDIVNIEAEDLDSDTNIDNLLADVKSALSTIRSQSSSFGSNLSVVQNRTDFTKSMINTLQTGADKLVLADTNEEAANLLALQTRQQLSSTALSMASQADQAVLRLF